MRLMPEGVQRAVETVWDLLDQGVPLRELPRRLILRYDAEYPALCEALFRLGHAAAWQDEPAALRHVWGNPPAEESVIAAALYAMMRYPNDPDSALKCAEKYNDDKGVELTAQLIKTTMERR